MRRNPNDPFSGIPYDQADPAPEEAGPPVDMGADPMEAGAEAAVQAPMLSQLGGGDVPMPEQGDVSTTDDLTGSELGALVGGEEDLGSPEDIQAEELDAMLSDPNTPPEVKQQIEALLALAARKSLSGVGGEPA